MGILQGLYTDSISLVGTSPVAALGQRRQEGGDVYVYAYHADTTQVVPGKGVAPATAGSSTSFMYTTVPGNLCAGVVKHTTFTTATWGWLLVKGYIATLTIGDPGTTTVGAPIALATNGVFNSATGAYPWCGQAFTATATGGAIAAHFVSCWY